MRAACHCLPLLPRWPSLPRHSHSSPSIDEHQWIGPAGGAIDAPLLHGLATLACWHAGILAAAPSGEEPPHWENISSGHSGRLPPTGRAINHLVIQVSDVEACLGLCLSFSTEEYLYLASPVPLQTWHFTSNLFYFTYQNCPKCKTPPTAVLFGDHRPNARCSLDVQSDSVHPAICTYENAARAPIPSSQAAAIPCCMVWELGMG